MKRFLWLTCLSCSIAALTACGNSAKKSGDGGIEGDGSVTPGSNTTNTNLDALKKEADDTKKQAADLNTALDGVKTDVANAGKDLTALDKRVMGLENPTIPAPLDGIALAQMGILNLVEKACTYEGTCCDVDELTLKYGPTIQSSKDCIDTFNDLVAKGVNPSFLQSSVPVVQYVVSLAQALSSSEIKVDLNKTAIKACTDWLDARECNKYVAPPDPDVVVTPHCTPLEDVVVNPCEVAQLVTGMQDKGELCGVVYGVDGCKDGLVCSRSQDSGRGICADPLGEGSRCLNDGECGGVLFCNLAKGTCQKRGEVGDDCEYLDPSFTSNQVNIYPPQSSASQQQGLAIQCKPGLECQPTTKKCVKACEDGSLCGGGNEVLCPDGFVCNVTEVPSLYTNTAPGTASYNLGVCRAPGAGGDACTLTTGTECESGNCQLTSGGAYVCGDPKKAVGAACDAAGADATCKTAWCGTDLKCVATCKQVFDPILGQYTYPCAADGFYCETGQQTIPSVGEYACEPIIASSGACSIAQPSGNDVHKLCASGFCNTTETTTVGHTYGTCEDKVATGAACPLHISQQCQLTEWCDPNATTPYTCVPVIAPGADCSTKTSGCGVGNYCYYDSTATTPAYTTCRTPGGTDGATCIATASINPPDCKAPLVCAGDNKCHQPSKYPDGVPCGSGSAPNDAQCLNKWCKGVSTTSATRPLVCATPIAKGEACDTLDTYLNRCDETSYCAHTADATAGTCTKQHTAGQACEPSYGGTDCLNNTANDPSACQLTNGVFVCNARALAPETVMCDGMM